MKNFELHKKLVDSEKERKFVSLKLSQLQDEVRSIKMTMARKHLENYQPYVGDPLSLRYLVPLHGILPRSFGMFIC